MGTNNGESNTYLVTRNTFHNSHFEISISIVFPASLKGITVAFNVISTAASLEFSSHTNFPFSIGCIHFLPITGFTKSLLRQHITVCID